MNKICFFFLFFTAVQLYEPNQFRQLRFCGAALNIGATFEQILIIATMVIAFNRNEWKSIIQGAICSKPEQKQKMKKYKQVKHAMNLHGSTDI